VNTNRKHGWCVPTLTYERLIRRLTYYSHRQRILTVCLWVASEALSHWRFSYLPFPLYFFSFHRLLSSSTPVHFPPYYTLSNFPFLSHHTVIWGILILLCFFACLSFCLFFFFLFRTVTNFSATETDRGVKFLHACSTTIRTCFLPFRWTLARGESRRRRYYFRDEQLVTFVRCPGPQRAAAACSSSGGQSELGARRWCLRPCGGICVLQTCWRTCLFFSFPTVFFSLFPFSPLQSAEHQTPWIYTARKKQAILWLHQCWSIFKILSPHIGLHQWICSKISHY